MAALRKDAAPDEELHALGMALATLEAAIGSTPEAFRTGEDHAVVVGDALVMVLARFGFTVHHDHVEAAEIAAEYERAPEQNPGRLS